MTPFCSLSPLPLNFAIFLFCFLRRSLFVFFFGRYTQNEFPCRISAHTFGWIAFFSWGSLVLYIHKRSHIALKRSRMECHGIDMLLKQRGEQQSINESCPVLKRGSAKNTHGLHSTNCVNAFWSLANRRWRIADITHLTALFTQTRIKLQFRFDLIFIFMREMAWH